MRVEEVTALARRHNMASVSSEDLDDTTAEMAFEFAEKSDARAFATALRLKDVRVFGPWKHDLPGFNHMVTVHANTE